MRAVLDANVMISGLIRPEGPPGRLLVRLLRDSAFELVASPATLSELRRTLRYPRVRKYLRLPEKELDLWVDAFGAIATLVEGKVSRRVVTADPADDIYIAAAADGLADYIVSGDRHLLDLVEHEGIRIVTPRTFSVFLSPEPGCGPGPPSEIEACTLLLARVGQRQGRHRRRRHPRPVVRIPFLSCPDCDE